MQGVKKKNNEQTRLFYIVSLGRSVGIVFSAVQATLTQQSLLIMLSMDPYS